MNFIPNFPPKYDPNNKPNHVTFVSTPPGSGKTYQMLNNLEHNTKYLIAHEFLNQVDDVVSNPSGVHFEQPKVSSGRSKSEHFRDLIRAGANVVCSHDLFLAASELARAGYLADYTVIIDETFSPIKTPAGNDIGTWEALTNDGWVTIDEETGEVKPTFKWFERKDDIPRSLPSKIMEAAQQGMLFLTNKRKLCVVPIPPALLTEAHSVTIMTYMAEASLLALYLKKIGIEYRVVDDPERDRAFKAAIRDNIRLKDISSLRGVPFSHGKQTSGTHRKRQENGQLVSKALATLRRRALKDTPTQDIMIGCSQGSWFKMVDGEAQLDHTSYYSKNSRLFGSNWVAPKIRGVNKYDNCSVGICLYEYNIHPAILEWLELEGEANKHLVERLVVSNFLQWFMRGRFRNHVRSNRDCSMTLYVPSPKVRNAFLRWVNEDCAKADWMKVSR